MNESTHWFRTPGGAVYHLARCAVTGLVQSVDGGVALLASTRRIAYLWALWSALSFGAVIFATGGAECLASGLLCGLVGVRRLWVLADRDYRADMESYEADRHDADVAWWLDRFSYSDSPLERLVARQLLTAWGVRLPKPTYHELTR